MALFNPPATFCPFEEPLSATALHIEHCADAETLSKRRIKMVAKIRVFIVV